MSKNNETFITALKEAAGVFILSRLVIIFVTYISSTLLPLSGQKSPQVCIPHAYPCLLAWYHWDAIAYTRIAFQGYSLTSDVAFFPLWPFVEHILGFILGGSYPKSYYFAALLLTNVFFYSALVLLYQLLASDFEPAVAKRTLFYFAIYPYAIFFFAGYTESLFLLLGVAIFLLIRRGRAIDWWLAGLLGYLATLTRSTGVVLVIPYLVVYIQRYWIGQKENQQGWLQRINAFLPLALFPAGILTYTFYLWYAKGNALIFVTQEATNGGWHRQLSFPWVGFLPALGALLTQPLFSQSFLQNLLDCTFILIPLLALFLGWKRIPLHYALFALGIALFSLSFPQSLSESLASQPRYLMMMFPVMFLFAYWGKHPWFDRLYVVLFLPLMVVNCILFISHYWVA